MDDPGDRKKAAKFASSDIAESFSRPPMIPTICNSRDFVYCNEYDAKQYCQSAVLTGGLLDSLDVWLSHIDEVNAKWQTDLTELDSPKITLHRLHSIVKRNEVQTSFHLHFDRDQVLACLRVLKFLPDSQKRIETLLRKVAALKDTNERLQTALEYTSLLAAYIPDDGDVLDTYETCDTPNKVECVRNDLPNGQRLSSDRTGSTQVSSRLDAGICMEEKTVKYKVHEWSCVKTADALSPLFRALRATWLCCELLGHESPDRFHHLVCYVVRRVEGAVFSGTHDAIARYVAAATPSTHFRVSEHMVAAQDTIVTLQEQFLQLRTVVFDSGREDCSGMFKANVDRLWRQHDGWDVPSKLFETVSWQYARLCALHQLLDVLHERSSTLIGTSLTKSLPTLQFMQIGEFSHEQVSQLIEYISNISDDSFGFRKIRSKQRRHKRSKVLAARCAEEGSKKTRNPIIQVIDQASDSDVSESSDMDMVICDAKRADDKAASSRKKHQQLELENPPIRITKTLVLLMSFDPPTVTIVGGPLRTRCLEMIASRLPSTCSNIATNPGPIQTGCSNGVTKIEGGSVTAHNFNSLRSQIPITTTSIPVVVTHNVPGISGVVGINPATQPQYIKDYLNLQHLHGVGAGSNRKATQPYLVDKPGHVAGRDKPLLFEPISSHKGIATYAPAEGTTAAKKHEIDSMLRDCSGDRNPVAAVVSPNENDPDRYNYIISKILRRSGKSQNKNSGINCSRKKIQREQCTVDAEAATNNEPGSFSSNNTNPAVAHASAVKDCGGTADNSDSVTGGPPPAFTITYPNRYCDNEGQSAMMQVLLDILEIDGWLFTESFATTDGKREIFSLFLTYQPTGM